MDKQEKIEKMAKIMCGGCIENELMTCSFTHEEIPCDFARNFAKALVNAGYGDLRAFAEALKEEFADGIEKYYAVDKVLNEFLGGEK